MQPHTLLNRELGKRVPRREYTFKMWLGHLMNAVVDDRNGRFCCRPMIGMSYVANQSFVLSVENGYYYTSRCLCLLVAIRVMAAALSGSRHTIHFWSMGESAAQEALNEIKDYVTGGLCGIVAPLKLAHCSADTLRIRGSEHDPWDVVKLTAFTPSTPTRGMGMPTAIFADTYMLKAGLKHYVAFIGITEFHPSLCIYGNPHALPPDRRMDYAAVASAWFDATDGRERLDIDPLQVRLCAADAAKTKLPRFTCAPKADLVHLLYG